MGDEAKDGKVVGRYMLHESIAVGGMSTVHVGRLVGDVGFARTVAIKQLNPSYLKQRQFVGMFMDEARVAGMIQHPNVAKSLDVVQLEGNVYHVMEYVHGVSLAQLLERVHDNAEHAPVKIIGSIVAQVLYGLHAAHEARDGEGDALHVIHRDVSPQNVLVGRDGAVRLIDFGVAKAAIQHEATRQGYVKGRLSYMAPEQIDRVPIDRRVDIYAAGVLLWEALVGKKFRSGLDAGDLLQEISEGDATPPSLFATHIPAGTDDLVLKALARKPDDRYQSALDFAEAVEEVLGTAQPHEVGEWVHLYGGHILSDRAKAIKRMEAIPLPDSSRLSIADEDSVDDEAPTTFYGSGGPGDPLSDSAPISTTMGRSSTAKAFAPGGPPVEEESGSIRGLIAISVLISALVVLLLWQRGCDDDSAPAEAPAAARAVVKTPPVESATSEPATQVSAAPAATLSATAEPSASAEPSAKRVARRPPRRVVRPRPRPRPRPRAAPAPRPRPAPTPTAKPNAVDCNPPYYLTEKGARRYKLECL